MKHLILVTIFLVSMSSLQGSENHPIIVIQPKSNLPGTVPFTNERVLSPMYITSPTRTSSLEGTDVSAVSLGSSNFDTVSPNTKIKRLVRRDASRGSNTESHNRAFSRRTSSAEIDATKPQSMQPTAPDATTLHWFAQCLAKLNCCGTKTVS